MRSVHFIRRSLLLWLLLVMSSITAWAQSRQVSGTVTSFSGGETLPGVAVRVQGTSVGTVTDLDGKYQIQVSTNDAVLQFSFVGYTTEEETVGTRTQIDVSLVEDIETMGEVVVVGYGQQKKSDLTGSVVSVTAEDFNKGLVGAPEQLIAGKVAGVQITSNGGAPGSGSRIQIRGGSSLNASNDPLIVIDGVPVNNSEIKGTSNPLSLINPDDIESFNILKDASATAIYGSRASNGVVIITTKKGKAGQKFGLNFSTTHSISTVPSTVDVLSAEEFRNVINEKGTDAQKALLGDANNNWQDLIYDNAYGTDNNLSFSGSAKAIPYRISLGYFNQDGILRGGNFQRTSAALTLNPSLLNDHLKFNLNVRGVKTNNVFADEAAIGASLAFDPTRPIYDDNTDFGGFYQWRDSEGNFNPLAPRNPMSLLEQRDNTSEVFRSIGNIQLDYKFHFLPDLRANLNLGYDISESEGTDRIPSNFGPLFVQGGQLNTYSQNKRNLLTDFYLSYAKQLDGINSNVEATAGYSFQEFIDDIPSYAPLNAEGTPLAEASNPYYGQSRLKSYFGRVNYGLMDRYLLTATLRADGSSKFSKENRWGIFPALALAWKVKEESFLRDVDLFSELKFRLGYGVTGQQSLPIDFPYLARYSYSDPTAEYQFGDQFYTLLRPEAYDENIKWEETITYNAGVDFGLFKGRINGSVDYYIRKTEDLLAYLPNPAGSNLTNEFWTNAASLENSGIEAVLNFFAISKEKLSWEIGINGAYNKNEITSLSKTSSENEIGVPSGGIAGGVGNTIQVRTVGYARDVFYVYKQVYDESGNPIEGLYADLNSDGEITVADKYRYKQPDPEVSLGLSSQLNYGNWNLNFVMRGSLGNYVYNNVFSNTGAYRAFMFSGYLANVSGNVLDTNFENFQLFSDYYVQNASFLRMDNLTLGYNFAKIFGSVANLRMSANVQNAFVITKYEGLDPEIANGIDNNFYPRPRIYSLSLNVGF